MLFNYNYDTSFLQKIYETALLRTIKIYNSGLWLRLPRLLVLAFLPKRVGVLTECIQFSNNTFCLYSFRQCCHNNEKHKSQN